MPLITFVVPCYNSENYMEHCIETLLTAKKRAEILIVDDGSTDRTGEIADRYQKENPEFVKAIHQENKGHGGALNTGIANAQGTYFKVVDSDDWLDPAALQRVLDRLEQLMSHEESIPDLFIADFIYDKMGEIHKKTMQYKHILPREVIFGWNEAGNMPFGKYVLMHSVIYRTEILRKSGLKLPEHCFYVDNLFVYEPLPYVEKMYYMDVKLYHYFIGRDDQSVHESVMIKRIDQQLAVNRLMIDRLANQEGTINEHCYKYMYNYLNIILGISSVLLIIEGSDESVKKMDDLWEYLKEKDPELYQKSRHGIVGVGVHLKPGAVKLIYHVAQKIYGFN